MIARESITTNVKQRDVDLALEILGVSAEEAAGKTVRKKTKIRRTEVQMSMEKEFQNNCKVLFKMPLLA